MQPHIDVVVTRTALDFARPVFHCDAVEERPLAPLRSSCRAAMKWLHLFSLMAAMTPWKWLARIAIASSSFSNRQEHRYNEQKTTRRYIRHRGQRSNS